MPFIHEKEVEFIPVAQVNIIQRNNHEISQPHMIENEFREKDNRFMQIQELIDSKRRYLINKQKKLKYISKQNQFLEIVKDDYEKYNNYINQQKQDQINALYTLDKYINDLTKSNELTAYNIKDAEAEQNKILKEIKSIKQRINNVVDNVKKINKFNK